MKTDDENKTMGIVLSKDKKDSLVEITLPEGNNQIFASRAVIKLFCQARKS